MNNRLKFKQTLNKWLFQEHCLLCASSNANALGLCVPCSDDLPWHHHAHCPQCSLPNGSTNTETTCGQCLKSPPHFTATKALFDYAFPINAILQAYKYQHRLPLARFFSTLFVQQLLPQYPDHHHIDMIIPMPLHANRLKSRGFNQALEVARGLSQQLNIPLDYESCTRIKNTPPQASLALKERIKNMQGVFHCAEDFTGKTIAIVDDVMTTGASMNALAKEIKKAGAKEVICWVVARTPANTKF